MKSGRVFYINKSVSTIGRDTACDVVLALGYPSRKHARISASDGSLILEDLNSTNGTFVNGLRIDGPTPVKIGDIIKFSTESFCLLDATLPNKALLSGKLPSSSMSNTANKACPDIHDTIIR